LAKIGPVPEGLIERIVLASGQIPTPLIETANAM
jgi:hypothetical protein